MTSSIAPTAPSYVTRFCLYLDNRHRVLRFEELFRGTIDGTSVYPREVVKQALAVNAAAIILALNQLWSGANVSNERLLAQLKEWCEEAEASGIKVLEDFAERLRSYQLASA